LVTLQNVILATAVPTIAYRMLVSARS